MNSRQLALTLRTRHHPVPRHGTQRALQCQTRTRSNRNRKLAANAGIKDVWLQTSNKAAFQAGLESGGVSAFVFGPDAQQAALAGAWSGMARFRALMLDERGLLTESGSGSGRAVGEVVAVDGPEAARALEARLRRRQAQGLQGPASVGSGRAADGAAAAAAAAAGGAAAEAATEAGAEWSLVLDARDWKVIPAENLVALAQPPASAAAAAGDVGATQAPALRLLAAAGSAAEGRLMLEALEGGTAGVLLRTEDPAEVRSLVAYVSQRAAEEAALFGSRLAYSTARVTGVRQLGCGDRVCVDLAGMMQPGEGLLVGSFARCLALVHSECEESDYIASRPFRANAGPVHSYVLAPGGRTRYLAELASGEEVLVAGPGGRTRTALVGRAKIERRPLVLVELETPDGGRHSLMLQNAETVKLVGPSPPAAAAGVERRREQAQQVGPWSQQRQVQQEPQPKQVQQRTGQAQELGRRQDSDPDPEAAGTEAGRRTPSATGNAAAAGGGRGEEVSEGSETAQVGTRPARAHGSGDGGCGRVDESQGPGAVTAAAAAMAAPPPPAPPLPSPSPPGGWRTLSVAALAPGDTVYVLQQAAARHTGIAIEEFIVEK